MTKILHVISGLGTGGAETMLVQLTACLKERGFSQQVVSVSGRGIKAEDIEAGGTPVTALGLKSYLGLPGAIFRIARLVNRWKPDIIQGWMYHGDLFATLSHLISPGRGNRRLFWNIRASNTDLGGYMRLVRLGARFSRLPDTVIANSRAGLDFHLRHGYRPKRSEIIPNGIDTGKFRPDAELRRRLREELGIAADALVAIHVARVDPMKDHETFVQAMQAIPHVNAVMAGAGTERLQVPPNVRVLGMRKDIDRFYPAADVVVSTSAFAEGFSNVLAEGMSAGLIPVTTDIGDAKLIVGDVGRIVPLRNPEALAGELSSLAAIPPAERESLGGKARQRIEQNFTLEMAASHFARVYSGH